MSALSYGKVIKKLASEDPDRIAVYLAGDKVTPLSICELESQSNRLARVYRQLGVAEGDIVTIPLANSIELLIAMLASWKVGAMPNPVSSKMPRIELLHLLEHAQPALLLGVKPADFPQQCCLPANYQPEKTIDDSALADPQPIGGERALASGGSTGKPKLIIPSARAVYDPATASALFKPLNATLVPGPLYHAVPFSATWQGILSGATVVVMQSFDASQSLALIEKYEVDRMAVVPTMMQRIWRLPQAERQRFDVSSLQFVMSGGAPLPAWLMQAWIDWLGPEVMHEAFGPSERIGGTFINGKEWLEHPGSVGKPLAYCKIKILDDDDNECAPGVMGEIYLMPTSGPGSTYHYVGSEGKRNKEGWESVGDMGYLDRDGYLFLGDRRSDMIICGGRNIYPAEIEGAIEAHPKVRSAAVIGMPDDDMGLSVYAIVDCAQETPTPDELKTHLTEFLTPYKIPKAFEFLCQPLRNDAGKVRRSELRAQRVKQLGNA